MKVFIRRAVSEIEIHNGKGIMAIAPVGDELSIGMTLPLQGQAVMDLDRDAVKALLPHLAAWVETGKLEVASS